VGQGAACRRALSAGARRRPRRLASGHVVVDLEPVEYEAVVELSRASYVLWLLLGEATSKSDHARRVLLRPEVAEELPRVFLVKGALATTAIEGNTLSEEEARKGVDDELKYPAQLVTDHVHIVPVLATTMMSTRRWMCRSPAPRPSAPHGGRGRAPAARGTWPSGPSSRRRSPHRIGRTR
jgi:hypothetical protein